LSLTRFIWIAVGWNGFAIGASPSIPIGQFEGTSGMLTNGNEARR